MPYKSSVKQYSKSRAPAKSYRKVVKKPVSAPRREKPQGGSRYLAPLFGAGGSAIGGLVGGPGGATMGALAGRALGEGIYELTGYGDYTIKENSIMAGHPPSVKNKSSGGGSVFISHKEYLGDVVSSSSANTFKIQKFPLQAGYGLTFPWLSQIAANFQEYRFHGLVFHFRSMSADALNSTNTALGSLIMSTEYNAAAPDFASKSEMENAQFANSIKPSDSCLHFIECAKSSSVLSNLYVRTDDLPSGSSQDVRFYDMGNFYIASTGCQGTSVNLGELWVTYEVELFKPKIWAELGETIDYYNAYSITGITNALPLGTASFVESVNNNISVTFDSSAQTLSLPPSSVPKSYVMMLRWRGTRTASLDPPATTYTNAITTIQPLVLSSGLTLAAAVHSPDTNVASLSTYLMDEIYFQTSGRDLVPVITFGAAGVLPATVTIFQVIILQVPNTYSYI